MAFEVIAPRSTVVGRGTMPIDDVNYQLDVLNAASGQYVIILIFVLFTH